MHAHQHALLSGGIPLHQRNVVLAVGLRPVEVQPEVAIVRRHVDGLHALHQLLTRAPVLDEVRNRAKLQPMLARKRPQLGQARHRAVVVHDLADHARWVQASQPRNINRSLGMAGAHQHPAIARDKGENMARRHNIITALRGINCDRNGPCPVTCRNPRGNTFARLDRGGKRRFMPRAIGPAHQF